MACESQEFHQKSVVLVLDSILEPLFHKASGNVTQIGGAGYSYYKLGRVDLKALRSKLRCRPDFVILAIGTNDVFVSSNPRFDPGTLDDIRKAVSNLIDNYDCGRARFLFVLPPDQHLQYCHKKASVSAIDKLCTAIHTVNEELLQEGFRSKVIFDPRNSQSPCCFAADGYHLSAVGALSYWEKIFVNVPENYIDVKFDFLATKYCVFVCFKTPVLSHLAEKSWNSDMLHSRLSGPFRVCNVSGEVIAEKLVGDRLSIFERKQIPYLDNINWSLGLLLPRCKSTVHTLNKKPLSSDEKRHIATRVGTEGRIVRSRGFIVGFEGVQRMGREVVMCYLCPALAQNVGQNAYLHFQSIEHRIQLQNCFAVKFCEEQPYSFTALETVGSCCRSTKVGSSTVLTTNFQNDICVSAEIDKEEVDDRFVEIGVMNLGSRRSYTETNGFYFCIKIESGLPDSEKFVELPLIVSFKIRHPSEKERFYLVLTGNGFEDCVVSERMKTEASSTSRERHLSARMRIPIDVAKFGANFSLMELLAVCHVRLPDQRIRKNLCQFVVPILGIVQSVDLIRIVDDLLESPGKEVDVVSNRITLFANENVSVVEHHIRADVGDDLPKDDEFASFEISLTSVPERKYANVISDYAKLIAKFRFPKFDLLNAVSVVDFHEETYLNNLACLAFPTPSKLHESVLNSISDPIDVNNFPLHIAASMCQELVDVHDLIPVRCKVTFIDIVDQSTYRIDARCSNVGTVEHLRKIFYADLVIKDLYTSDVHYFSIRIKNITADDHDNCNIFCLLPSQCNDYICERHVRNDWSGIGIYESKGRADLTRAVTVVCKAAAGMLSKDLRMKYFEDELEFDSHETPGKSRSFLMGNIEAEYAEPQKTITRWYKGKQETVLKYTIGKYNKLKSIHFSSRNGSSNLMRFLKGLFDFPEPVDASSQMDQGQPMCCHPQAGEYKCKCFDAAYKDSLLEDYRPVDAVMASVESDSHTTVIHGPVGTGKTFTATNFAVEYVVKHRFDRPKVMLIAETNEAAVNIFDQISEAAENQSFDHKHITYFVSYTEYSRKNYSTEENPNIQAVWSVQEEKNRQKQSYLDREEADGPDNFRTIKNIFLQSSIVVSTRNLALRLLPRCRVMNGSWNKMVVIVDEASQITFPQLLFLVPYASKLVCVGDSKQTGPYITHQEARDCLPLSKCSALSFIQRCKQIYDPQNTSATVVKLYCNFRFSSSCAEFISSLWYQTDHPLVAVQNEGIVEVLSKLSQLDETGILGDHFNESSHRLAVVNIEGQSSYCQNMSTVNIAAASAAVYIIRHLAKLGNAAVQAQVLKKFRLGVLSLNTAQRRLVQTCCEKENLTALCDIEFLTIRKSQGKTFDFVVLSIEQSDYTDRLASSGYSSGFSNTRDQVLVAVSRMRYGLFLICNMHRLLADSEATLFQLIRNTPQRALYCNKRHPCISSSSFDVTQWLLKLLLCDSGEPTNAQRQNFENMGVLLRASVESLRKEAAGFREYVSDNLF